MPALPTNPIALPAVNVGATIGRPRGTHTKHGTRNTEHSGEIVLPYGRTGSSAPTSEDDAAPENSPLLARGLFVYFALLENTFENTEL